LAASVVLLALTCDCAAAAGADVATGVFDDVATDTSADAKADRAAQAATATPEPAPTSLAGSVKLPIPSWLAWTAAGLFGAAAWYLTRRRRHRLRTGAGEWISTLSASRFPVDPELEARSSNAVASADRSVGSQVGPAGGPAAASPSSAFAHEATDPMMLRAGALPVDNSAVSVDELIDLDQQCEFFVALGQDAVAVELLREKLRSGLHRSPLPYLKLLEIHLRQGDVQSHDRVRRRLLQRFQAPVPARQNSMSEPQADGSRSGSASTAAAQGCLPGVSLLPAVVEQAPELWGQLQAAWQRPTMAQALIQQVLFPEPQFTEAFALLGLEAHRELLFLHAILEDVQALAVSGAGAVDVHLPLNEEPHTRAATTHRFLGSYRRGVDVDADSGAEVDLDLSAGAPALGFFDSPLPRHSSSSATRQSRA